jgi:hypothetical protein
MPPPSAPSSTEKRERGGKGGKEEEARHFDSQLGTSLLHKNRPTEIRGDLHFLRADVKRPESQLSGSYLMST